MKTLITIGVAAAGVMGLTPGLGAFHLALTPEEHYVPPASCIQWYDGCNMCLREDNGSTMCSNRACENHGEGFCRLFLTATSSSSTGE